MSNNLGKVISIKEITDFKMVVLMVRKNSLDKKACFASIAENP